MRVAQVSSSNSDLLSQKGLDSLVITLNSLLYPADADDSVSDTASADGSPFSTPDFSEADEASTSATFPRKNSSPRFFEVVRLKASVVNRSVIPSVVEGSPAACTEPVEGDPSAALGMTVTCFEEQKRIICDVLRRDLHTVPDVERRLFSHLNAATSAAALLILIQFFIKSYGFSGNTGENFEFERESLDRAVNLLESDEPDYTSFQGYASYSKGGLSVMDNQISEQACDPPVLPASAQGSFLKLWLLQALMQFLDRLMEFFSRIQCVPLSPFCTRPFSC